MKKNIVLQVILFYLCSFFSVTLMAQRPDLSAFKTKEEGIQRWLAYCESLKPGKGWSPATGNTENLQQAALEGLKMTQADDAKDRARFLAYEAQGFYYRQDVQSDSIEYYYRLSLQEASKANDAALIMNDCVALMHIGFEMQEEAKVDSFKRIVVSLVDTATDKNILQDGYAALGSYFQQKSYYSTAADYFIKSIELKQKQTDTTTSDNIKLDYANKSYTLAKLFLNTGAADKALDMLYKGNRFKGISPLTDVRYASSFIEVFCAAGKIDSALAYLKRYIGPLEEQFKNRVQVPAEVVFSNLAIAQYYIDNKKYDSSFSYLQKGFTLGGKSNEALFKYRGQKLMARYFTETGSPLRAIPLLTEAIPVAKEFSKEDYADMLKYMALSQQATGNSTVALQYYGQYTMLLDTLIKEKISRNFADLETRYQTNEKEQKIISLDKENRLKVLQLENASRTKLLLVIGLIALSIIALLLYFIYRNKEKLNSLLNEQNDQLAIANETKAKLFAIIGHDLRSPVSQIVQLLQLQKAHAGLLSDEAKQGHEVRLRIASENVLQTMEDLLLWSKSQMEHFTPQFSKINVSELVKKETSLLAQQAESKRLNIVDETTNSFIKKTDENFLAVVIRNLLQNAVKYSDEETDIIIKNDDNSLYICNQSDNGNVSELNALLHSKNVYSKGFGLGLKIANDLAAAIHTTISFAENTRQYITVVLHWEQ